MTSSWIFFSILSSFITSASVITMKYIAYSKCNVQTIVMSSFLLASFLILLYIPFDKHFVTDLTNNICIKDFLLIGFFTLLLISSKLIQTYTFKISPNIAYSHLIINANIIITLIAGYLLFNQIINYKSAIGIIITIFGLYVTIIFS